VHLRDLTEDGLAQWVERELGGPAFRATQVFEWIHRRRTDAARAMTNLPLRDRERLAERADLTRLELADTVHARDNTRKLRFRTQDGHAIEAVLIPNDGRGLTLCVSTMTGCPLGCRFCATASRTSWRNLATWEIVDQLYAAQDLLEREAEDGHAPWPDRITNLVLMGMGEPLENYDNVRDALSLVMHDHGAALAGRRITVSTAGVVPGIERFAREGLGAGVGLAISLNATTDEVRSRLMPINRRWNIAALTKAARTIPRTRRRRLTFEYVLIAGQNDGLEDADRLADLVDGIAAHTNVIPYNPHPHADFRAPSDADIDAFVEALRARGLLVFARTARGADVAAACGQLTAEADRS
jgi:23S rRNA (adenine2503-C2)-methyltransferase